MTLINTRALVLKYTNYGESDRIITIFSKEYGKMQAVAKGSRKQKSQLLSASQAFCHADYVLYKGNNDICTVSQCNVINTFYDIVMNLDRFAYGSYVLHLCNEVLQEESNTQLYYLLIKTLESLSESEENPIKTTKIFEFKLLDLLGYRPLIGDCVNCDVEVGTETVFSVKQGGLLCYNCAKEETHTISGISWGSLKTIQHIFDNDFSGLKSLRLSDRIELDLNRLIEAYMEYILEKDIKLYDFIKKYSLEVGS